MIVTLANLREATQQQVFDQVVKHLRTQKAQSRGHADICLYRSPCGLKCAAGALIADNEYKPEMDQPTDAVGTSWDNLIDRGLVPVEHRKLIRALQCVHDHSYLNWEMELWRNATMFGLTYTQPSKEAA